MSKIRLGTTKGNADGDNLGVFETFEEAVAWMKDSTDRILAVDESGNKLYYGFEVDYEPVFYVSESKE